jgi:hypothetical protein
LVEIPQKVNEVGAPRQLPEFLLKDQEVAIIEPCVTEQGAVMVDFNLFKFLERQGIESYSRIDFSNFKVKVDEIATQASKIQFSERLGICKMVCPRWDLIIARTGRVVVRRAKNEEDIEKAINVAFHLIEGSLIE